MAKRFGLTVGGKNCRVHISHPRRLAREGVSVVDIGVLSVAGEKTAIEFTLPLREVSAKALKARLPQATEEEILRLVYQIKTL